MILKRGFFACLLLLSFQQLQAQQYGLFNTKTLFDGFENPAQKVFTLDSSRKFASNFLLPYLGATAASQGNSDFIRKAINENNFNAKDIPLGNGKFNTIYQQANIYVLTLKIFNSYKYQKELGFSWQIRTDGNVNYTNETIALLDTYRRFTDGKAYDGVFNNKGYNQTYHQFSVTYRENYTKRLSFGAKFSLLSGSTYNKLNIADSYFQLSEATNSLVARLKGNYRSSFENGRDIRVNTFMPTFRNPGASISFGTSYQAKSGVFLMANIKDLGFIYWGKSNYESIFNGAINIPDLANSTPKQIENKITDLAQVNLLHKGFYSPTNAKIDAMISKTYGFYTPSLIVSKNLFFNGGDVAFVNRFRYEDFSLSVVPDYNFNKFVMVGVQAMYQTPNFEFFLGSDNLFKSVSQANGYFKKDASIGSGYNGASVYLGLGIKFGNIVEHPQNSSTMPGVGEETQQSFFKKLFGIFSKKK